MFRRMALLLCLLLLVASTSSAPPKDSTIQYFSDQDTTSSATSTTYQDEDVTTQKSSTKSDQDSLAMAALAQSLSGNGDFYDQRQDGDLNLHVRVDNATIYFVMLDGLGELAWRKGNKGNVHSFLKKRIPALRRAQKPDKVSLLEAGAAASPHAVSASPPAAVSASTPPSSEVPTPSTKPPRSTYKPPESKPEPTHTSVIEILTTRIPDPTGSTLKVQEITTQKEESQKPTTQKQTASQLATAKSQARSEEQLSILNLLKRTASLTAHSTLARRNQPSSHHISR